MTINLYNYMGVTISQLQLDDKKEEKQGYQGHLAFKLFQILEPHIWAPTILSDPCDQPLNYKNINKGKSCWKVSQGEMFVCQHT